LEDPILTFQIIFIVAVTLTVASGLAVGGIAIFGNTGGMPGNVTWQKIRPAHAIGAAAIISLLALPRA
jgi:hypothetical protein